MNALEVLQKGQNCLKISKIDRRKIGNFQFFKRLREENMSNWCRISLIKFQCTSCTSWHQKNEECNAGHGFLRLQNFKLDATSGLGRVLCHHHVLLFGVLHRKIHQEEAKILQHRSLVGL